jgi:cytochrome P450
MTHPRPEPRFENGRFYPALPVPDPDIDEMTGGVALIRLILRMAKNPTDVMGERSVKERFATFQLGRMYGNKVSVILGAPDLIRQVFVTERHKIKFNPIRQSVLKPILRDSLISAEGEVWRRARHAATPLFTPRAVGQFAESMRDTASAWVDAQNGGEVKLDGWTSGLTYEVLKQALFSGNLAGDDGAVTDTIAEALGEMGRPDPADMFDLPGWVPRLSKRGGRRAVARFRALVRETIAQRRTSAERPDDLLSRLLDATAEDGSGLSDEELEDNVLGFIGAGHETTARWLSWWLYLLSQDGSADARAVKEAKALDVGSDPATWAAACPYLLATMEEALRLYPSVPFLSRITTEEMELDGQVIPENSDMLVNMFALHRHRELWDDPGAFVPERFLGEAREAIPRFAYLPFGVGERVCIGQRFAMQEGLILGALMLRAFRFDYVGAEAPWPMMRVTIGAHNGMPMQVERR